MKEKDFNLAAIDVGSNAARLLIKKVEINSDGDTNVSKLLFLRIPLRLGMDVFSDGKISDERAYKFVAAMKAFRQLMKVYGVKDYRACATSAMRDARNGDKVMKRIREKAHIALKIISGDEESKIIYESHLSRIINGSRFPADSSTPCLYVDVGGGSTEVSLICDGERVYSHSFNIGTIRLLKGKVKKEDAVFLKEEIERITKGLRNVLIIGSGGNINKLCQLSAKKNGKQDLLPVSVLRKEYGILSAMSVEERMAEYGLKPDRADVIVPAAEVFLNIAESSRSSEILVPVLGLADGLINDMLASMDKKD